MKGEGERVTKKREMEGEGMRLKTNFDSFFIGHGK